MFSNFPSLSGQRNGYSAIPSAINDAHLRKTSVSLDGVLENWEDRDEIKYQKPNSYNQSAYYYSDSQQPEGILESGKRFFAHLIDSDARTIHNEAIDAVVKDLRSKLSPPNLQSGHPHRAVLKQEFKMQRIFGQPLPVGTLKESLQQPQKHSVSLNFFGSARPPEKNKSAFEALKFIDPLQSFSFSGRNSYQPIPENSTELQQKSPLTSPFPSYQSGDLFETTKSPSRKEDFQSVQDSTVQSGVPNPRRVTSTILDRSVTQDAEKKKSSASGSSASDNNSRRSTGQNSSLHGGKTFFNI